MKLILFDIDGTLIHAFAPGQRAANRAFEKLHGIENALDGIRTDGRTDPIILRSMFFKSLGRDFTIDEEQNFYEEYVHFLEDELSCSTGVKVLPGVINLLDILVQRKDYVLGVGTGNIESGAWMKLIHAGLREYFSFGGFGSDAPSRDELIRIAILRGKNLLNGNRDFEEIYVVGDTPLDVINGRAAGARTIAVATGRYSKSQLIESKPDYLFSNFHAVNNLELF